MFSISPTVFRAGLSGGENSVIGVAFESTAGRNSASNKESAVWLSGDAAMF